MRKAPNRINLEGMVFGRLKVIGKGELRNKVLFWPCICECGNELYVRSQGLRLGYTKSCGCLQREIAKKVNFQHGMSKKRIHNIWCSMTQRCENENSTFYKDYGGRGIAICERWKEFTNFMEDMGIPEEGMTIERINNDGNYEPDNCRWTDRKEQANNRRSTKLIEFNGESMTASAWEKKIGLSKKIIWARLERGWSIEKTLNTPPDYRFNPKMRELLGL